MLEKLGVFKPPSDWKTTATARYATNDVQTGMTQFVLPEIYQLMARLVFFAQFNP